MVHHSKVNCVPSRQSNAGRHNVFRQQHVFLFDRENIIDDREKRIEGGLNGITGHNSNRAMHNFLEHLRVGEQPLSL